MSTLLSQASGSFRFEEGDLMFWDVSCPPLEGLSTGSQTLQCIAVVLERMDRHQTPERVCGHYSTPL